MQDFNPLRETYKEFIYHNYEILDEKDNIHIKYYFEIPNLTKFEPTIKIVKKDIKFNNINNDLVHNLVFNIGMVELISYWKAVCPPKVIIKCGYLNAEQIEWFKKLYYYGLGEYRYKNNINTNIDDMLEIIVEAEPKEITKKEEHESKGVIIPVGGGKDSTVTLELLKDYKADSLCLIVNPKIPSLDSAKLAGYGNNKIIEVIRQIDNNLIKLNENGYLNGHTPFSALLAFLSYLIAHLTNKKYIALSNESSADESNLKGEKINHQYSKSFEFEEDFRNYAKKYLRGNEEYFSFLRPINELQIAMLFAKNRKYYNVFKSCNEGSKKLPWQWCCKCPKCLFVYIILSPFLYKSDLINIFKEDLFEKEDLLNTFIDLCGYGVAKPFECVGTYDEVNFAITKTIFNLENKNGKLPYLLKYYKENYKLADLSLDLNKKYNERNNLPKEFDNILRKKILNG